MRPVWKGAISFGLVSIPIRVYSATQNHDLTLHMVHSADGGRIRYQRRCEECGKVVDNKDIDRAHISSGHTVIMSQDELNELPAGRDHDMDVVEFVPAEQVDVLRLDKSYFLEPEDKSLKSYVLLRRMLEHTDRLAIVEFALRNKTRMGALRAYGDALVVQTLLWDDEVRDPKFDVLESDPAISQRELDMAEDLVDSLSANFDEDVFTDEYQKQLQELIEAKLSNDNQAGPQTTAQDTGSDGEVIDLMQALERSVNERSSGKSQSRHRHRTRGQKKSGSSQSNAHSSGKTSSAGKKSSTKNSKGSTTTSGTQAKKKSSGKSA